MQNKMSCLIVPENVKIYSFAAAVNDTVAFLLLVESSSYYFTMPSFIYWEDKAG